MINDWSHRGSAASMLGPLGIPGGPHPYEAVHQAIQHRGQHELLSGSGRGSDGRPPRSLPWVGDSDEAPALNDGCLNKPCNLWFHENFPFALFWWFNHWIHSSWFIPVGNKQPWRLIIQSFSPTFSNVSGLPYGYVSSCQQCRIMTTVLLHIKSWKCSMNGPCDQSSAFAICIIMSTEWNLGIHNAPKYRCMTRSMGK